MKQIQGFGTVMILVILGVVVLVGGSLYINIQNTAMMEADKMAAEKMQMEEKAMMEKTIMEKEAMKKTEGAMMDTNESMMKKGDVSMMKKNESMKTDDAMMKKEESAMMNKSGTYIMYSGEALAMAQKGKTVLFFHASWCPNCRTADADIVKNIATIPSGVTILKVDYDKEVALKQKYGVTHQHTFVEIDASGALVEKWSGGDLAGIIAKL